MTRLQYTSETNREQKIQLLKLTKLGLERFERIALVSILIDTVSGGGKNLCSQFTRLQRKLSAEEFVRLASSAILK